MSFSKFLLAALAALASLSAVPAHAAWKVVDSKFNVTRVLDTAHGNYRTPEAGFGDSANHYWDAFAGVHHQMELHGDLVIREYDRSTISKRTTTLTNVYAIVDLYGIALRAGTVHNLMLPIRGMQGKPVSAIFSSPFHGGKFSLGIGAIVGVNPNYSFAANAEGVRVADVEKWLRAADVNVGLEVGYLTIKFNTESLAKNSKNIQVSASGASVSTNDKAEPVSMEAVQSRVVGSKD